MRFPLRYLGRQGEGDSSPPQRIEETDHTANKDSALI